MSTTVRISYDAEADLLVASVPEVVLEGLPREGCSEPLEGFFVSRQTRRSRPLGFTVFDARDWDVLGNEDTPEVWGEHGCRFDVPALALRDAAVGEIVLATWTLLRGSTPDAQLRRLAQRHEDEGQLRRAEAGWSLCLATGDLRAHLDLGRVRLALGRPGAAFAHLEVATRLVPRCAKAQALLAEAQLALASPVAGRA